MCDRLVVQILSFEEQLKQLDCEEQLRDCEEQLKHIIVMEHMKHVKEQLNSKLDDKSEIKLVNEQILNFLSMIVVQRQLVWFGRLIN